LAEGRPARLPGRPRRRILQAVLRSLSVLPSRSAGVHAVRVMSEPGSARRTAGAVGLALLVAACSGAGAGDAEGAGANADPNTQLPNTQLPNGQLAIAVDARITVSRTDAYGSANSDGTAATGANAVALPPPLVDAAAPTDPAAAVDATTVDTASAGVPAVAPEADGASRTDLVVPGSAPASEDAALEAEPRVARSAVARSAVARSAVARSAEALAQFAQVEHAASETLTAAGLAPPALRPGQCVGLSEAPTGSFSNLGEIQLLDVGEVVLLPLPADGANAPRVSLAPHAFPSVSSFISGVVYTSRDRAADALPSGVRYEISVSGSAELPGFRLQAEAPQPLSQITVGGEPLASLSNVDTQSPLDATWAVGQAGDVVVLELGTVAKGDSVVRCAFADESGTGTVPLEWLNEITGEGHVTLHRQRTQQTLHAVGDSPTSLIQVGFDFETSRAVEFVKQ
jgi:hypothetical protein